MGNMECETQNAEDAEWETWNVKHRTQNGKHGM